MRALNNMGVKIAPGKIGPDYIDGSYLSKASGREVINLDGFAFDEKQIKALAFEQAESADLLLIEGVMGLFDGANGMGAGGKRGAKGAKGESERSGKRGGVEGSTANIAQILNIPVIMVIDCSYFAQSISALVYGYKNYDKNINLAGIILNKVASLRHEEILRESLTNIDIEILGVIYKNNELKIPSRHLGLTLADEIDNGETHIEIMAEIVKNSIDLEKIYSLAKKIKRVEYQANLTPLGQNIAIAKDICFSFIYQHILLDWKKQGANISFFSPLNNEAPEKTADAVFLPGGYPELYGEQLSKADNFFNGLRLARDRGALIYGECGGFMVLGQFLIDERGKKHKMSALLPFSSSINKPKRILGYRNLSHNSMLPFAKNLKGHEFHYSTSSPSNLPTLFKASDAKGNKLADMGVQDKNIMGSYAHIISENREK